MLQWLPRSDCKIIWNDRADGRFVSHILNVVTGQRRTLPHAVFTLSPDGVSALSIDFRRLEDMRPGYGYMGFRDPWHDVPAPRETGIHSVDLRTGTRELIVSLAEVASIPYPHGDIGAAKHYFNVLIFNPSGSHFLFLHRWRFCGGGFHTRMLTARADGSALTVVDHSSSTSHLIWRDEAQILAWSRRPSSGDAFYLFPNAADGSCGPDQIVGKERMPLNGHCTYLSDNNWVLNDTYPQGRRAAAGPLPLPRPERPAGRPWPVPCAAGLHGHAALRPAPALQPGRQQDLDRFGARRAWAADVSVRGGGGGRGVERR